MLKKLGFLMALMSLLQTTRAISATVAQKDLRFKVSTELLYKGNTQYALEILAPDKIAAKYPEIYELDSLSLLQGSNVQVIISKIAYIVNKPSGFFDHEHIVSESYVSHVYGDSSTKKTGPNSFRITPVKNGHTYEMHTYYDSDDMSTLPTSKIIRAVTASKKLDVISLGASSTVFTEMNKFSDNSPGATSVTSYVPLKENKTLVLKYELRPVRKVQDKEDIKKNFLSEALKIKSRIENFK